MVAGRPRSTCGTTTSVARRFLAHAEVFGLILSSSQSFTPRAAPRPGHENIALDTILLQASDLPVVPICRIGAALIATPNQHHILRCPVPLNGGRFAIVTNVGCGMRWTRWHGRRTCLSRTVKSCGPDASMPALNRRNNSLMMVATKPDHQGEHEGRR